MKISNKASSDVEITVQPDILLPPLSTTRPEQRYSFLAFLDNYVLAAPGMRKDENLPALFEWEEARTAFYASTEVDYLQIPGSMPRPQADASPQILVDYESALSAFRIGKSFTISNETFKVARSSAKALLDDHLTPDRSGNQAVHPMWGVKILRFYYAFISVHPNEHAKLRSV